MAASLYQLPGQAAVEAASCVGNRRKPWFEPVETGCAAATQVATQLAARLDQGFERQISVCMCYRVNPPPPLLCKWKIVALSGPLFAIIIVRWVACSHLYPSLHRMAATLSDSTAILITLDDGKRASPIRCSTM